jgi:hypothetical protein
MKFFAKFVDYIRSSVNLLFKIICWKKKNLQLRKAGKALIS